jgi:DNA-binding NarL/FixJ family response regulator
MLATGLSNQGIARELHLSTRTVESHTKWIFRKLGLWPSEERHRRVLAARTFILATAVDDRPVGLIAKESLPLNGY